MIEYPYPFVDEQGKVICQICGKSLLVISPPHLGTHKVKFNEYRLRYPDAPTASHEFTARSVHGKEKVLFVEDEMKKFEEDKIIDEIIEDLPIVEKEPDIDELDLEEALREPEESDIMSRAKNRILDYLRSYFTNIEKDYLLTQYGPDKLLKFQYITDFCDPILKIIIQFPNTFWHNKEKFVDTTKNNKLARYHWRVIEINSTNPSLEEIQSYVEGL